MALIRFNPNNFSLDVLVGIKEEYKPHENIDSILEKIEQAKDTSNEYLMANFKSIDIKEILEITNKEEEKKIQLDEFIQGSLMPRVNEILALVDDINKEICPNYEEVFKKR